MTDYKNLPEEIDVDDLLRLKGIYLLGDVCQIIPFSVHQIRFQAKKVKNSKQECGTWKDQELKRYLVDMEIFAKWIKRW